MNGREEDFAAVVREVTGGKGAEAVLEFVGTEQTLPKSFASLTRTGVLVVVGFQPGTVFACDPTRFVDDEITVTGSRYVNRAELAEAAAWVGSGPGEAGRFGDVPPGRGGEGAADLSENRVVGRAPVLIDS